MILLEYRIPMPLTVEEYQIGHLWNIAKTSRQETGGGSGVRIVQNQPFEDVSLDGAPRSGQYTYKMYFVKEKVPYGIRWLVDAVMPKNALVIHEESWSYYPGGLTMWSMPHYLENRFYMETRSLHVSGKLEDDNMFGLSDEDLEMREVVDVDIATGLSATDSSDPATFQSAKTGRGPLKEDWAASHADPMMTVVKLIRMHLDLPVPNVDYVIRAAMSEHQKNFVTRLHMDIFCSIDEWKELSLQDMREHEEECAEELKREIEEGAVRGNIVK